MAITVARIKAVLDAETKAFDDEIGRADKRLKEFTRNAGAVGQKLTIGVTAPLTLLGKKAIETAASFETNLARVRVATQATDREMQAFRKTFVNLGNDAALPGVSAASAASQFLELRQAGLSTKAAFDNLRPALQFAAINEMDAAQAARITAAQLNVFPSLMGNVTRALDSTQAAFRGTGISAGEMEQALESAGGTLATLNIPVEDANTLLGLLRRNFIRGAEAGTVLRNAFRPMANRSQEARDALAELEKQTGQTIRLFRGGQFVGAQEAVRQLAQAFRGLSQETQLAFAERIFGPEAARGIVAFAQAGTEGFSKLNAELKRTGLVQAEGKANAEGLAGAIDQLKAAFETALITGIEPVKGAIKDVADAVSGLLTSFSELSPEVRGFIVKALALSAALGPVITAVAGLVQVLAGLKVALGGTKLASGGAAGALRLLTNPITILAGLIVGLAVAWKNNWFQIQETTGAVASAITSILSDFWTSVTKLFTAGMNFIRGRWRQGLNDLKASATAFQKTGALDPFGGVVKEGFLRTEKEFLQAQRGQAVLADAARKREAEAKAKAARDEAAASKKRRDQELAEQKAFMDRLRRLQQPGRVIALPETEKRKPKETQAQKDERQAREELRQTTLQLAVAEGRLSKAKAEVIAQFPLATRATRLALIAAKEELQTAEARTSANQRAKAEVESLQARLQDLRAGGGEAAVVEQQLKGANEELVARVANLRATIKAEEEARQATARINDAIRAQKVSVLEATAATSLQRAAIKLFGEEMLKANPNIRTVDDLIRAVSDDGEKLNKVRFFAGLLEAEQAAEKTERFRERLRGATLDALKAQAVTLQHKAALELFGDEVLKTNPNVQTLGQLMAALTTEDQRNAVAVVAAAQARGELARAMEQARQQARDTRLELFGLQAQDKATEEAVRLFGAAILAAHPEVKTLDDFIRLLTAEQKSMAKDTALASDAIEDQKEKTKEARAEHNNYRSVVAGLRDRINDLRAQTEDLNGELSFEAFLRSQVRNETFRQDQAIQALVRTLFEETKRRREAKEAAEAQRRAEEDFRRSVEQVAQQVEGVFEEAFGHLNEGFGSFFDSVVGGFEKMLQEMAAKFLASQLTQLLAKAAPQIFGFLGGVQNQAGKAAEGIGAAVSAGLKPAAQQTAGLSSAFDEMVARHAQFAGVNLATPGIAGPIQGQTQLDQFPSAVGDAGEQLTTAVAQGAQVGGLDLQQGVIMGAQQAGQLLIQSGDPLGAVVGTAMQLAGIVSGASQQAAITAGGVAAGGGLAAQLVAAGTTVGSLIAAQFVAAGASVAAMLASSQAAGGAFGAFGGAMAHGGPVAPGQSFLVGENGPELFTPRVGGNITPTEQVGGVTINFNITTPDAASFRRSQSQIQADALRLADQARRRNRGD